ncbi:TIGR03943 family protein [Neobacillus pocheonensis]|uniref:TIGR03943 family protein n=1 Tax=Neobacillus pocheonensis TaxID=363869 RepID=A0ABT0W943_9BACI|nr:TIGR03943 family protein [Neobacillus pocheonensis]
MKKENEEAASFHQLIRGIILIGFMLFLFKLLLTNNITLLIAPKMVHFIYFTIIIFLILGVLLILRGTSDQKHQYQCDCDGKHSYPKSIVKSLFFYLLFILPIITGFLFANNVLNSSVAMNRTIKLGANSLVTNKSITVKNIANSQKINLSPNNSDSTSNNQIGNQPDPLTESEYDALKEKLKKENMININDNQYVPMMNIIQDNLKDMIGKTVTTKGFVYREKNFMQNQIIVARFGITCCVADASVYGFMAKGDVTTLAKDKWVQVTGTIEQTQYDGSTIPIINIKQISKISAPEQPYVFDVGVKIE